MALYDRSESVAGIIRKLGEICTQIDKLETLNDEPIRDFAKHWERCLAEIKRRTYSLEGYVDYLLENVDESYDKEMERLRTENAVLKQRLKENRCSLDEALKETDRLIGQQQPTEVEIEQST